ncbi:hypothetical protein KALB_7404 [Kutzneria albida DSM 43870]|uniref:Aminoacyl-tRNA synthetase class I anticodon-binding domain-containing protein n=1 Tax=Kutzneria albida DSM 43870 TaxID=1449976 RepID=W5WJL9_9PSEU|nr:hypothetical protein KALB_7404 [Kutzneria albida DSM 43870]
MGSAAKALGADARAVLAASIQALTALPEGTAAGVEGVLVDGVGLKRCKAFAPVRVAVAGRTVSPLLYESMVLLGRERSLDRPNRVLESNIGGE